MRQAKRWLAVLLVLVMAVGLLPVQAEAAEKNSTYTGGSAAQSHSTTKKPAAPSVTGLKLKKGKTISAAWKKVSGVSGYQLQFSPNSSFKQPSKTLTFTGQNNTSKTFSVSKNGTTYYVRMRSYKTSGGGKVYSAWTKAKTVKTAAAKPVELFPYFDKAPKKAAQALGGQYVDDFEEGYIYAKGQTLRLMTFKQGKERAESYGYGDAFRHAPTNTIGFISAEKGFCIKGVTLGESQSSALTKLRKIGKVTKNNDYLGPDYYCSIKNNSKVSIWLSVENGKVSSISMVGTGFVF